MSAKFSGFRTAESVSPRHPDKICDQISDAILDAHLKHDPDARVAVDVAGGHGKIFITGEVTSRAQNVNITEIVRRLAGEVETIENIAEQSPEIANGVDGGGAGDQGIMIGYATSETPEMLPLEVVLARRLNQHLYGEYYDYTEDGLSWPYDGKTQVTLKDGKIDSVVASFQHAPKGSLKDQVLMWLSREELLDGRRPVGAVKMLINPAGDWKIGGFDADAGLTGRKLAVDNYGPRIPIGGGAFSGKDPSKVDRSAAYMARKIAVDYLKQRQANEVYVRLAYAIGVKDPVEASVIIDGHIEEVVGYNLTPSGIINSLNLKRPIYEQTARYGHFGNGFDWEE